ncbi:MAG: hypothetical protein HQ522_23115 [Bacteroidetes bacterium]|nr:hypothetical protein [Bacteroidota bacterium]
MKVIVIVLLILGGSAGLIAQNYKQFPKVQKLGFNEAWQKNTLFQFGNSPKLKQGTPSEGFQFSQKMQGNLNQLYLSDAVGEKYTTYRLKMPVIVPSGLSRMPIFIPDSTVNFAIKIKKFDFVNPMETNK